MIVTGLTLVAIPTDQYETIMETLRMDGQSSAFDRELRREIRNAHESVTEITGEIAALLTAAQHVVQDAKGIAWLTEVVLAVQRRMAIAATPNIILDAQAAAEDDDE